MASNWPSYAQPVPVSETADSDSQDDTGTGDGGGGVDAETHRYVDKSMETVKAQNDARFAEVLTGIEKVNNNLSAFGDIVRTRLDTMDGDLKDAKDAAKHAESATRSIKWNILATAIAVIGVLLATWSIWAQGIEMVTGMFGAAK
jgi:hypothetical protein